MATEGQLPIGSYVIDIKIKSDEAKQKQSLNFVSTLTRKFALLQAGILGGTVGLSKLLDSFGKYASRISKVSLETGFTTDELQKLERVSSKIGTGLSADQLLSGVANLRENLDPAGQLSLAELLDLLRIRLTGLSKLQKVNLLKSIGIDPNFLKILEKSNKEIASLSKGLTLDKNRLKELEKFSNTFSRIMTDLKFVARDAGAQIAQNFNPALEKLANFIDKNSEKISSKFANITTSIVKFNASLFKGIGKVFKNIKDANILENLFGKPLITRENKTDATGKNFLPIDKQNKTDVNIPLPLQKPIELMKDIINNNNNANVSNINNITNNITNNWQENDAQRFFTKSNEIDQIEKNIAMLTLNK